ncbi:MAG: ATP-binding protein [Desulfobacterales bacterium]
MKNFSFIRKSSLFYKITILVFLILILAIGVITAVSIREQTKITMNELIEKNKIISKHLSSSIKSAFWTLNWLFVEKQMQEITNTKDVTFLELIKPNGEIYMSSGKKELKENVLSTQLVNLEEQTLSDGLNSKTDELIKLIQTPIKIGSDKWTLIMGISLNPVKETRKRILINSIIWGSTIFILGVLVSFWFARGLTMPIKKLVEGTKEIGKGNLDYKINIKSLGELGELADSFNDMAEDLKRTTTSRDELAIEINERKQAEENLRSEREQLATILDGNPIPIFMIDQDHKVVFWNRALENVSMVPRENALNKTVSESLRPVYPNRIPPILADLMLEMTDEELMNHYGYKVRMTGLGGSFESTTSIWPEGKKRILDIITTRIRDHQGNILGAIQCAQDVTDKKLLEDQLLQSHKMESIGTLAGGIAHDFNNILGIILGNIELGMDDIAEWHPARLNLEEIRTASLRAKDVVRQLLSFARKTRLERKPTNIIPIVEESLRLLRSSIPTSIEIRQNIAENVDPIIADPTQINQILINLCTNANHAMPDGGTLEINLQNTIFDKNTSLQYPGLNPGRYVNLTVSDTGHGISQEDIDRIFDPYFTTKEVGKGTGMGLAVIHGIVKDHNGVITVKSELEKGTTFSIFFPVVEKEAEVEIESDEELPTGDERILFVDDEEVIVKLGRQRLKRLGYKIETAISPIEALKLFRSQPDQFDLVITDMMMPKMTGDKLVKEILNIRSDIPIILCTGFSEKIDEKMARKIGTADYIEKPYDKTDLAFKVRKVLNERQEIKLRNSLKQLDVCNDNQMSNA